MEQTDKAVVAAQVIAILLAFAVAGPVDPRMLSSPWT